MGPVLAQMRTYTRYYNAGCISVLFRVEFGVFMRGVGPKVAMDEGSEGVGFFGRWSVLWGEGREICGGRVEFLIC